MKKPNLSDIIAETFSNNNTVLEPVKSTRLLSVRELRKYGPQWISHRFKIKGGIPLNTIMIDNVAKNNVLYEKLKKFNIGKK